MTKTTAGIHYTLRSNALTKAQKAKVLSALDGSPVLDLLAKRPIAAVDLVRLQSRDFGGYYDSEAGNICINTIRRSGKDFGQALRAGQTFTMAQCGVDTIESMRRTLIHEVGHHLEAIGGPDAEQIALLAFEDQNKNPITAYGRVSYAEYWAESLVAFHVEASVLKSFDPRGFTMVEDVLDAIGKKLR